MPLLCRLAKPWIALLLVALPIGTAGAGEPDPVRGRAGMVVSTQHDAARAGQAMLARGGNAVDAAVATAFAVGVTQPFSAGLGGGAFVLIRLADGRVVALDARETAPAAADRDMYVREGVPERASLFGPLAVATPGFVRGMALALERWGTLPLDVVLAPAIRLAEEGFAIGPYHAAMLQRMRGYGLPRRFPETGRIQFPDAGASEPRVGWRLVQKDLAATLRRIAEEGPEVFHTGDVARAIADHMKAVGGLVTLDDLAGYTPKLREPVRGTYRGLEVVSFPPPSSGGIALVETLNILEGLDLSAGAGSEEATHAIAEAMKLAFADRAAYLGDSDFVDVPTARLVSKEYAAGLRARLLPVWWRPSTWSNGERAITVEGPGLPADDAGTTHLSTSDALGNVVALTMTINTPFGSGITVPGTGIVLNNEMDDFAVAPDTPNAYGLVDTTGANAIAPGKRPLSSMTPTVLLADGAPFMVTGSPGGPRIITTTLLTVLNVVDFGMNVQQAVAAPRFHHQWVPDTLFVEPETDPALVEALRARGHEVKVAQRRWSAAEAIVIGPGTGTHEGGADPRTDGLAVGFDGTSP
ncbi:MAG: gamma-glutamyltransferase [Myxococcota bacterium]